MKDQTDSCLKANALGMTAKLHIANIAKPFHFT
jgi:hypothetical protein